MGLDMYLRRKFFVKNYSGDKDWEISISRKSFPSSINIDKICSVETEEIYWRKANSIHNWFVNHVQGGKDDCGEYYVRPEQLKELLDACNKVLDKKDIEVAKKGAAFFEGMLLWGYRLWRRIFRRRKTYKE